MFFNLNDKAEIGYKSLTDADLGRGSSHQTHIGLFESTLSFVDDFTQQSFAQFIYDGESKELFSFLDPIESKSGSLRSPKIRSGTAEQLVVFDEEINSVVKEIRNIATNSPIENWYLLWFGLDNSDLVFYLFNEESAEFDEISDIIGELEKPGKIEQETEAFPLLIKFLNSVVTESNSSYLQDLEIVAQTSGFKPKKRRRVNPADVDKAKEEFAKIGRKGEELMNAHFKTMVSSGELKSFEWMNKNREQYLPYDFTFVIADGSEYFTDVKTTSHTFDQKIVLSANELDFIRETNNNYKIHRVYDIKSTPKFKVCSSVSELTDDITDQIDSLRTHLNTVDSRLRSAAVAIPPTNGKFKLSVPIEIISN